MHDYLCQVKSWITLSEPDTLAVKGYELGTHAPGLTSSGTDVYTAAYTLLKAHAMVYRLYHQEFRSSQKGQLVRRGVPSVSSEVQVITERSVGTLWRIVCIIGSSGHHRKVC